MTGFPANKRRKLVLTETRWQGPQWLTGGLLGPEASWMVFVVIACMFAIFDRCYRYKKFPL